MYMERIKYIAYPVGPKKSNRFLPKMRDGFEDIGHRGVSGKRIPIIIFKQYTYVDSYLLRLSHWIGGGPYSSLMLRSTFYEPPPLRRVSSPAYFIWQQNYIVSVEVSHIDAAICAVVMRRRLLSRTLTI